MIFNTVRLGARTALSKVSRGSLFIRQRNHINKSNKIFVRHGGGGGVLPPSVGYRCMPPDDPLIEMVVDTTMTLIWFWMFWNFYHSGEEAFTKGLDYHEYADATDEELGIA